MDTLKNWTKLFQCRFTLDSKTKGVTLKDVGYLICGGYVPLTDGSRVYLENAFELAFESSHLKAAREKCGYCPCSRQALYH